MPEGKTKLSEKEFEKLLEERENKDMEGRKRRGTYHAMSQLINRKSNQNQKIMKPRKTKESVRLGEVTACPKFDCAKIVQKLCKNKIIKIKKI